MEYFYITQDKRYRYVPYINDFYTQYYPNLFCPEQSDKIKNRNVVYSQSVKKLEYIDILSGPILLVSEQVKKVFEAYDEEIYFKMFFILNTLMSQEGVYYAPILPSRRCLTGGKRGIQLALDREAITGKCICYDGRIEYSGGLIVDMAVTESLLRRRAKGIIYQRLEAL